MRKLNFKNTITDYSKGRSCCNKHKHFNKTRLLNNIKQSIYGIMVFCGLTVGTCTVAQSMFGEEQRTLSKNVFDDNYNKINYCINPDTLPFQLKAQQPVSKVPFIENINNTNIDSTINTEKDSMVAIKTDTKLKSKSSTKTKTKSKNEHSKFVQHGIASHMGHSLHGHKQASGERHNKNELICAHKTLPFGTRIRVTNLKSGQSVIVRVTDRGPFGPGRIVDLSLAAARKINIDKSGVAKVKIEKIM